MPNFKQFIKGFEEPEAQPKAEPKPQEVKPQPKKETPRGFVVGKDGFFEPKEYSEEEQNNAYFGAARFFSKSGKGPEEFLKEHPDYNADSVYAAYNDYKAGNEWKERKKEKEETLEQPKPEVKPEPQKSVGEDAQERYLKDFYKQAKGNRDEFIDHHIRRFGVPTGSTKKKEMEFYGKKFDEMKAQEEPKPQPKPAPRFKRAKQPQQGSFQQIAKSFDEPEQKQFSKEEIALADKTADYLDNYLGYDGFEVRKLPNGNYLTNVHLGDPDEEPEEVGPEVMLAKYKELIEGGVDPEEIA